MELNNNKIEKLPPSSSQDLLFHFTADGLLRHGVTNELFTFRFRRGSKGAIQQQAENQALCIYVTLHVHRVLEDHFQLQRVYLPTQTREGNPLSGGFVYMSSGALEKLDTLVVLIPDWGTVQCGLWSWRLAAKEGLELGSQIPYVRRAMDQNYSVLLMNPNEDAANASQGGYSLEPLVRHIHSVWRFLLSRCAVAKHVVVVAHSHGGMAFVDLLCRWPQEVMRRVWAVAFLDSYDNPWHQQLSGESREWLRARSRRWVLNAKGLNEPVSSVNALGVQMSAGTQCSESAPAVCMEPVFQFFLKTLQPKKPTVFSMITRSRILAQGMQLHKSQESGTNPKTQL
ncbi:cotranscriptional regulator ARB2A homolog [Aplochiton taeniatus]